MAAASLARNGQMEEFVHIFFEILFPACFTFSVLCIVRCRKAYQTLIPNGDRIPHPCDDDLVWGGVGHYRPGGGGPRNPFGEDFEANSMQWTVELCRKDSDGDGRTNGEELGDPHCRWTIGTQADRNAVVTHPGICEPVQSPRCKMLNGRYGDELACDRDRQPCPALTEDGVQTLDIRLPKTKVPNTETNYYCMIEDLPTDKEYHLTATTPIIQNSETVHHMLLFGCTESKTNYSGIPMRTPYKCGMVPHNDCQQIIGVWTLGLNVDCGPQDAAFRIGKNGFQKAAIQLHWNNPDLHDHLTDSSGMTIYYTPNLRQYDAELFMFGQEYLKIPPMTKSITYDATCPSDCTVDMFHQNVFITRAVNHMHYLGVSQDIGLYRNGERIKNLTDDVHYDYDDPKIYNFHPPIEMRPGDELKTTCTFKSDHKDKTVYFGEGTQDEMCYAFITYHPSQKTRTGFCMNWKSVQRCRRYLPKFHGLVGSCQWKQLLNPLDPVTQKLYNNMQTDCPNYLDTEQCTDKCAKVSAMAYQHPCLKDDDIGLFVKMKLSRQGREANALVDMIGKCHGYVSFGINLHFSVYVLILCAIMSGSL